MSRKPRLVSPLPYALGTAAEELLFALLAAERDDVLLRISRPFDLPAINGYRIPNKYIFDLCSDRITRDRVLAKWVTNFSVSSIYIIPRLLSRLIFRISGFKTADHWNFPRFGIPKTFLGEELVEKYSWDPALFSYWRELYTNFVPPQITTDLCDRGWRYLKRFGFSETDWYVCLHVREPGFRSDTGRRPERNFAINSYLEAINAITAAGGWVVRIGDPSMTPLPTMERVIDAAAGPTANDWMNLFLIHSCRFYLGCQSGPFDVAVLFKKPMLTVNMYHWIDRPRQHHDRAIFQRVYSKKRGRFLSIAEILEEGLLINPGWDISGNYGLYANDAREIREAVTEFIANLGLQNVPVSNNQLESAKLWSGAQKIALETATFQYDRGSSADNLLRHRLAANMAISQGYLTNSFLNEQWKCPPQGNRT